MTNAEILEAARHAAEQAPNWLELSDFLFHPSLGLLAKAFPNAKDRAAFFASSERDEITKLLGEAIDRDGFDFDPASLRPAVKKPRKTSSVLKQTKQKPLVSKATSHARIPHH